MALEDAIMYLVLSVPVLFAASMEIIDSRCGTIGGKFKCEAWRGSPYIGARVHKDDKTDIIYEKLIRISESPTKYVTWRRSFVLAFIVNAIIFGLVFNELPPWQLFYIGVFAAFGFIQMFIGYFQFHQGAVPIALAREAVDILRSRTNTMQ